MYTYYIYLANGIIQSTTQVRILQDKEISIKLYNVIGQVYVYT